MSLTIEHYFPRKHIISSHHAPYITEELVLAGLIQPEGPIMKAGPFSQLPCWKSLNQKYIEQLPNPVADLVLAHYPKGRTIYAVQNGTKRMINSAAAFESRGYSWNNVIELNGDAMDAMIDGPIIA
jgi:hypothetical protein